MKTSTFFFFALVMMFFHSACTNNKPEQKDKWSELQLRAPADPKPSLDGILESQQKTAYMVVRYCANNHPMAAIAWMKPRNLEVAQAICNRIAKVLPSGYQIMPQEKVKIKPFGKDEQVAIVPFVLTDGGYGKIFLYMKQSSGVWCVVR